LYTSEGGYGTTYINNTMHTGNQLDSRTCVKGIL
jgi:hypothetical protein